MKRSKFSLSHYKLFSCDMGELIPCGLLEVLPGDSFQHATSMLVRCAPLLAPVMHPVHINVYHFYVPHRLVWEDFEDFITGGPDGMDDTVAPYRTFTAGNPNIGSLADYLGIPPNVTTNLNASTLPFRGYNMIWNEFFRDQDLQNEAVVNLGSGEDTTTSTVLKMANWEKDYFTSARPWEQKGPAITIPLGTEAPVLGLGKDTSTFPLTNQAVRESDGTTSTYATAAMIRDAANERMYVEGDGAWPNIRADLSGASAVTVNVLREAMALQRYEEARARYGSRYTEYLRYLGVRSSDARLQRPEYLGGGRQTIQFSEVLQTAEGTDPVGTMVGHGIGAVRSNRYRRFFEEHGYVFTLMCVRPKTMYSQGLKRLWSKTTKEDYWQRELQHIGQQPIYRREVYGVGSNLSNVFGYQDRYDEYRRQESSIAGEFRNSVLDYWHMARDFSSAPALNDAFVTCTPTERTFAAPNQDVLYVMANHHVIARRMVAKTGSSHIF